MITQIQLEIIDGLLKSRASFEEQLLSSKNAFYSLKEPVKPDIIEDPKEWLTYIKAVEDYDNTKVVFFDENRTALIGIRLVNSQLKGSIPPNTWVKVSGDRYIGYQTDSWPGYEPELLIMGKEEELPILKHRNSPL